ncbi:uncharacterized protein Z520_07979 [Fonsecaea multimorphosa CBS 102226]|uniref:Cytochrome P450 n=1 Tax=Fonsecaea multimorphosa CBS 102226 TaxID=1442371 RepID=A0A0D2IGL5_9EURO|nr:uncharacterized protein Z520_07979 [Fonsecaea multimorphosa CBS 102226]KIX96201.1 hypothetical protein Z520_07979 [Fonsecaea multimorphosa CBS 102226]OAL22222.1 hypothetical protein AYO22_07266 [Fonsecaea multimorphosa]
MFLFFAFWSLVSAYLIWTLIRFTNNYLEAKKIGLPILICPINPASPLWMLVKDRLIPVISSLPWGLGEWATRAEVGWTFNYGYSVHARYGEAFTIVSSGTNEIYIADPSATEDIMRRRNDFIKDPAMYGMLDIYGPNLDTVNGKVWDRHRKITVPPFNEQNSALVWRETAEQADQMLKIWSQKDYVTSTQPDVHAVALNVLCGAGFGIHSSFIDSKLSSGENQAQLQLGYRESLRMLLSNIIQLVLLSVLKKAGVPDWMFFGNMQKLSVAYEEFKRYMSEMLAREKTAFEQGDLTRHNLMSALIRASEQSNEMARTAKDPTTTTSAPAPAPASAGLSDEEVYGNLFIYNLAGHDTTAATLHFAITLLALYPKWQTWIAEEIDQVRKADPSGMWYYEETFPKLERCLALMYETVRLYGPVVMMPRYTGDSTQRLSIQDKECVLPPKTSVTINFAALHTHPQHWGPDPTTFRPDRWIVPKGEETAATAGAGEGSPSLFQPLPGSFVPWNAGPRVCPGKKFSQVEFTRVIFSLFANGSRVELVPEPGESEQATNARILRVVSQAKVEVTLKLVDAERVKLRWTRKAAGSLGP